MPPQYCMQPSGTVRSTLPRTGTPLDDVTDSLVEDLDDTVSGVTGGLLP